MGGKRRQPFAPRVRTDEQRSRLPPCIGADGQPALENPTHRLIERDESGLDTLPPRRVGFVPFDSDSKRWVATFHPIELPDIVCFRNVPIVEKDIRHAQITEFADPDTGLRKQPNYRPFQQMLSRPDQPADLLDCRQPAFVLRFPVRFVYVLFVRTRVARPTDRHQVRRFVRPTPTEWHDVMYFEIRLCTTVDTLVAIPEEDLLSQPNPLGGVQTLAHCRLLVHLINVECGGYHL